MEPIELCNDDLHMELFENVKFFMFAEAGAMGEPGAVCFVTQDKKFYHMNYVYGDVDMDKLEVAFPILKKCDFSMFGEGSVVPNEWQYVNLGMGNHLLVEKSVYNEFAKHIESFDYPDIVFQSWLQAAMDTL